MPMNRRGSIRSSDIMKKMKGAKSTGRQQMDIRNPMRSRGKASPSSQRLTAPTSRPSPRPQRSPMAGRRMKPGESAPTPSSRSQRSSLSSMTKINRTPYTAAQKQERSQRKMAAGGSTGKTEKRRVVS